MNSGLKLIHLSIVIYVHLSGAEDYLPLHRLDASQYPCNRLIVRAFARDKRAIYSKRRHDSKFSQYNTCCRCSDH